jgi:hypothetical protein
MAPTGKRFIFLHRWMRADESVVTRLYGCNVDGTGLQLFPDSGMYSHANWIGADEFLIWGRAEGAYARVRKSTFALRWFLGPVLRFYRRHSQNSLISKAQLAIARDGFLRFSGNHSHAMVGTGVLNEDGHPSVCPVCPQLILLDTYEDRECYRHLLVYHLPSRTLVELGKFHSPPEFNSSGFRCDLHPRWSPSGRMVCIDSIYAGRRQMLVLDVAEALSEWIKAVV